MDAQRDEVQRIYESAKQSALASMEEQQRQAHLPDLEIDFSPVKEQKEQQQGQDGMEGMDPAQEGEEVQAGQVGVCTRHGLNDCVLCQSKKCSRHGLADCVLCDVTGKGANGKGKGKGANVRGSSCTEQVCVPVPTSTLSKAPTCHGAHHKKDSDEGCRQVPNAWLQLATPQPTWITPPIKCPRQ